MVYTIQLYRTSSAAQCPLFYVSNFNSCADILLCAIAQFQKMIPRFDGNFTIESGYSIDNPATGVKDMAFFTKDGKDFLIMDGECECCRVESGNYRFDLIVPCPTEELPWWKKTNIQASHHELISTL